MVGWTVTDIPIPKGGKARKKESKPSRANSTGFQGRDDPLGWKLCSQGPWLEAGAIIMFTLQMRERRWGTWRRSQLGTADKGRYQQSDGRASIHRGSAFTEGPKRHGRFGCCSFTNICLDIESRLVGAVGEGEVGQLKSGDRYITICMEKSQPVEFAMTQGWERVGSGWLVLMCGRDQHNIVKQLPFN